MVDKKEPEFMTVREMAEQLSVDYHTMRRFVLEEMSYIKIGRCYRVRRSAFENWLKTKGVRA